MFVEALLEHASQLQMGLAQADALGDASVDAFEAIAVERVVTIIEECTVPAVAPVAQPGS
ncbi:hypothetical protein D3C80_1946300 [compost metagenome]